MTDCKAPYSEVRKFIKPGDVIGYHRSGIGPKFIAIYEYLKTKTPLNLVTTHVSMCASGPERIDRRLIVEAAEGEVNIRALSNTLHLHDGKAFWYPLREELNHLRPSIDSICWEQVGKKYDFGSVLAKFGTTSLHPKKFFCSELCQYALQIIPYVLILEIIRNMKKEEKDFPFLKEFFNEKTLRPQQLVQLPFYKPRVELL
jgi:hypothetical protein